MVNLAGTAAAAASQGNQRRANQKLLEKTSGPAGSRGCGNPCVENRGMRPRQLIFLLARGRKLINVPPRRDTVDPFIP